MRKFRLHRLFDVRSKRAARRDQGCASTQSGARTLQARLRRAQIVPVDRGDDIRRERLQFEAEIQGEADEGLTFASFGTLYLSSSSRRFFIALVRAVHRR